MNDTSKEIAICYTLAGSSNSELTPWLPIETAPAGQSVLVWDGKEMHVAQYVDGECQREDMKFIDATHWHPTAAPPK